MVVFIIILSAIFAIGLYFSIDYKLGRRKHFLSLVEYNHPLRTSNFDIITHGPQLFEDLFQELKKAQTHIHTQFYICKNDQISEEFLTILKEKALEGVEVRLLLDRIGSISFKREIIKDLEKHHVQFAFSQIPKGPYFFYSLQVRNHRKTTVIDGALGYIGGYNVGKEYINLDPKLTPWRDYHLKATGEGVHDLQQQFLLDWYRATKIDLRQNTFYFPTLPTGVVLHRMAASEGFTLEETFSSLIKQAKSSITVGSPYFIPSKRIFNDLITALNKGVSVNVIVPFQSDHLLVQEASYPFLRTLIKKGANIYQYMNGFYHAKVLIIDTEVCDLGTANFDNRSFYLNYEMNCFIYDRSMIKQIKKIIEKDILDSKKVALNDISTPNFLRSLKEIIARGIAHFL